MRVYSSIAEIVGNTPIIRLERLSKALGARGTLFGKLEYLNPTGSAKDRPALNMILTAEKDGALKAGGTIIEPTSGNTGIALAALGAARGYRVILTMPDTMSKERIGLLKAYGAEVVLTNGAGGMAAAIDKANELANEIDGAYIPAQFDNPANPAAHAHTTGAEIFSDMDGDIAAFVAGVGTGGTLSGTAEYLKGKKPEIKIIAVEPKGSPLLTEGRAGAHDLQGIGANFVPKNLNMSLVDEVIDVTDADAFETAKLLARTEGILCGITSGAALYAAAQLSKRGDFSGGNIVALLPDSGDRYVSTGIYD